MHGQRQARISGQRDGDWRSLTASVRMMVDEVADGAQMRGVTHRS